LASWSFKVSDLVYMESPSAVLVMISANYVRICDRFHARRVDSGKITDFVGDSRFYALVLRESFSLEARNFDRKKTAVFLKA